MVLEGEFGSGNGVLNLENGKWSEWSCNNSTSLGLDLRFPPWLVEAAAPAHALLLEVCAADAPDVLQRRRQRAHGLEARLLVRAQVLSGAGGRVVGRKFSADLALAHRRGGPKQSEVAERLRM